MESTIIRKDVKILKAHFMSKRYVLDLLPVDLEIVKEGELQKTIAVTFFDHDLDERDSLETIMFQRKWINYKENEDILSLEYNPENPDSAYLLKYKGLDKEVEQKIELDCELNEHACNLLSYTADMVLH